MVRTVGTNESHALSPVDNRARVPDGAIGKCHLFHLIGRIRKVKIEGQLIFSSTNTQNEIILAGLHSDIIRRDIRSHADCIKIRPAILKVKDFVPTVSTPEEIRVTPWPPDQGVIARPAIQGVVAGTGIDVVITAQARDDVGKRRPLQKIWTVRAREDQARRLTQDRIRVPDRPVGKGDLFHLKHRVDEIVLHGQLVAGSVDRQQKIPIGIGLESHIGGRHIRGQANGIHVTAGIILVEEDVLPKPPAKEVGVVAWAPNQEVIARAAIERVVAIPSEQLIVATKSLHEVVPSSTTKKIILISAGNYK